MDCFIRLKHLRRAPPGLEWKLFRRLPLALLGATAVPMLIAFSGRAFPPDGHPSETAKHLQTLDIFSFAVGLTAWTALLTAGIGCVIVIIMKGPAYVADGYSPQDAQYQPRSEDKTQ